MNTGQRISGKSSVVAGGRDGRWVLAIVILALAVRVVYLLQARGHLFFNSYADSLYYLTWAQNIVQGRSSPPVFYMGPLYPYLLAFFYRILGPGSQVVLWFQVLLGSASCGLIYLLGRMVFGRAVGLLAALMGALYAVEIFYEGALLMTTTLYVLNLLLLVSIFWALRRKSWFVWIVPGLLLGLSALGRANVLAYLPFLVVGIFLLSRARRGKGVRWVPAVLAVFLGVFLAVVPVTMRNFVVGDDLVLITSNLGLNFFVGNNPDAHGYYEEPRGLDMVTDHTGSKIAEYFMGRELKPSEISRFWLDRALAFVKAHPGEFLKLIFNKTLFFWNAYEIPQLENVAFFKKFVSLLKWPLLRFSILGPLGILGMLLSLKRWRHTYVLLAFVFSMMIATAIFFVIARLRLQVCSALMVFAAYALVWLWEKMKARKLQPITLALLALIPLSLLVNWHHPELCPDKDMAKAHCFFARHLWNGGDLQGAAHEYQRAVAIYPYRGETYVSLGNLRYLEGRADEVLDLYEKALQVDPRTVTLHLILGNLYVQKGMWDRAIREYREEIRVSPYNLRAYEALARVLQEKKKLRSSPEEGSNSSPHR
ncbi:glycosyltransferase family 39 protein [bacterium]|nr:glycosyltransferase family 39 protein [bacterium]